MNLQQLRYVVATAELGTMTAAASALHVAQPALSRAVRLLEQELGVTIFARNGRGIELTDPGQDVVVAAERILAEVDRLAVVGQTCALRVSATKGQARELASPVVSRQVVEYGDRVHLSVLDSADEVFESVRTGSTQLGIVELPGPEDLQVRSLGWQEIVLVYPPHWDLPRPLPVGELGTVPLLSPPAGDWRREALESGLRAWGVKPNIAAETTERELFSVLVVEGAGAAFSYGRQAAAAHAFGANLAHLDPPAVREVGVVYSAELKGRAAAFAELVEDEADTLLLHKGDKQLAKAGRISGFVLTRSPRRVAGLS